jgi:hypothetical protein
MTCRPQEGEHAALVRRWHGKTNYWRELAKQSSPSLVNETAKFWRSRLFVKRFDWDYFVIACSLAVIVLAATFILFLWASGRKSQSLAYNTRGIKSVRAIADELNRQDISAPRRGSWHPTELRGC